MSSYKISASSYSPDSKICYEYDSNHYSYHPYITAEDYENQEWKDKSYVSVDLYGSNNCANNTFLYGQYLRANGRCVSVSGIGVKITPVDENTYKVTEYSDSQCQQVASFNQGFPGKSGEYCSPLYSTYAYKWGYQYSYSDPTETYSFQPTGIFNFDGKTTYIFLM